MKETAKKKLSALELSQSSGARVSRLKNLTGPASLLLGGGCLFLIAGLVCFWQSWLMVRELTGAHQIESYTTSEVQALGQFTAATRIRITQALPVETTRKTPPAPRSSRRCLIWSRRISTKPI
jgi:hypothetical protein